MTDMSRLSRRTVLQATGLAVGGGVTVSMGAPADPSATVADGPTAYVATRPTSATTDGKLHAVDVENGSERWAVDIGGLGARSSPTVADGTVYVGSQDENLYAFDAVSGTREWAPFNTDGEVNSSPTVVAGTVFVGSDDGTVYAVDAETGDQEWQFTESEAPINSSPSVVHDTVYVGGDGGLYALDSATGEQRWLFETESSVETSPTVLADSVYFGHEESVYAINALTGKQQWTFTAAESTVETAPTVVDSVVYVGTDEGNVFAIDAEDGTQRWSYDTESSSVNAPTVDDGVVYVSYGGFEIDAIDANTGQYLWTYTGESGGFVTTSDPTVFDGVIYAGSRTGAGLYAVEIETETEQWTFTDNEAGVDASPTVVADPETGDSVDSRVRLGTLGHHGEWADQPPLIRLTLDASDRSLKPGEAVDVDVVVGRPVDGISSFDIPISVSESAPVSITDFAYATSPDTDDSEIASDGNSMEFVATQTYDAAEEITLGTITLAGEDAGETGLVTDGAVVIPTTGEPYTVAVEENAALSVELPPVVGDRSPADLNDDGLFEDITGNGQLQIDDVQALFENRTADAVQEFAEFYNFSGLDEEEVTIFDVQALFNRL